MEMEIFDVEHLQKIVYERSKEWATLLDCLKENERFTELKVAKMDSLPGVDSEEEDSNDMASIEGSDDEDEEPETEFFDTVRSATGLTLLLNKSTFALTETATKKESDIMELVNETMPIINEHNRQLQETGFDKILNTFDKTKIEEKVGSWLNRHNSLYGGESSLATVCSKRGNSQNDNFSMHNESKGRAKYNRRQLLEDCYESDDSLQSGETARYIRSSRAGCFRKPSSKTMIKTHCMLKSASALLKDKHSCTDNDSDYYPNGTCYKVIKEYEYHRRQYKSKGKYHDKKHSIAPSTPKLQRRKILRKRLATPCYNPADFSDSDYYNEDGATCCIKNHHCSAVHNTCSNIRVQTAKCSVKKISPTYINRRYYYFQKLSKSLSSLSSSSSSAGDKSFIKTKRKSNTVDSRPCKRVSGCKCGNYRKSCEKYKHVADTSTEDCYADHNEIKQNDNKTDNRKNDSHVQSSSKKLIKSVNNTNEATFFTATQIQVVCNSTAMSSNSPAYKRQFPQKVQMQQQQQQLEEKPKETSLNKKAKQKEDKKSIVKKKSSSVVSNKNMSSSSSNVTSTSVQKQSLVKDSSVILQIDSDSDCAMVTSTTNHKLLDNNEGILIYAPNPSTVNTTQESTNSEGYFTITKKHLRHALGDKLAEKFLKYYVGRRRFNVNSTIYYVPPKTKSLVNISSSSDSDDCLDNLGEYGDLYECL